MSSIGDPDWKIKNRSLNCQVSGRPFEENEIFNTVLRETPEGFERIDLGEDVWPGYEMPADTVSHWRSKFKPDPPAGVEAVGKEDAESELRRLLENLQPEDYKTCRLLALLLERKRILKARERTQRNGQKIVVYEHALTQETLIVPEVDFKLNEVEDLIREIGTGRGQLFRVNEPVGVLPDEPASA